MGHVQVVDEEQKATLLGAVNDFLPFASLIDTAIDYVLHEPRLRLGREPDLDWDVVALRQQREVAFDIC
jgi:hypothetical protein